MLARLAIKLLRVMIDVLCPCRIDVSTKFTLNAFVCKFKSYRNSRNICCYIQRSQSAICTTKFFAMPNITAKLNSNHYTNPKIESS